MFDVRKKMTIKKAQPETPQISKIERFATTVDKIKWNTEKLKILRVLTVMFWTLETLQFAEDFNFFLYATKFFGKYFASFFIFLSIFQCLTITLLIFGIASLEVITTGTLLVALLFLFGLFALLLAWNTFLIVFYITREQQKYEMLLYRKLKNLFKSKSFWWVWGAIFGLRKTIYPCIIIIWKIYGKLKTFKNKTYWIKTL